MELEKPQQKHKESIGQSVQSEKNSQFSHVDLQIQFDEEYPLHVQKCSLNVVQAYNNEKMQVDQQQKVKFTDKIIQIKSHSVTLEIPFSSILCLGKKSSTTTLLMLKDKEKLIQRDQDGIQLVSDEQDEEEFEDKENQLYQNIKKVVSSCNQQNPHGLSIQNQSTQTLPLKIRIDQKCTILLTLTSSKSQQLYMHLSSELENYQKQMSQQNQQSGQNLWTNPQFSDLKMMYLGENNKNGEFYGNMEGQEEYGDQNEYGQLDENDQDNNIEVQQNENEDEEQI